MDGLPAAGALSGEGSAGEMSLISGYLNQTASHYVTAEFYNGAPLDEIPLNDITIGEDFASGPNARGAPAIRDMSIWSGPLTVSP